MSGPATPFARILETAIERTPGALGGAFAASDGEMVDFVTTGDPFDWAVLTAYYGVILASLESLLDTQHFGGAEYFVVENARVDVIVHAVQHGYFALLAVQKPASWAPAVDALAAAAPALRREMQ